MYLVCLPAARHIQPPADISLHLVSCHVESHPGQCFARETLSIHHCKNKHQQKCWLSSSHIHVLPLCFCYFVLTSESLNQQSLHVITEEKTHSVVITVQYFLQYAWSAPKGTNTLLKWYWDLLYIWNSKQTGSETVSSFNMEKFIF